MLFFCRIREGELALLHDGRTLKRPLTLAPRLEPVLDGGPVLVVEGGALPTLHVERAQDEVTLERLPPEAVLNLHPYRPPRPVVAGGGYVVRRDPEPELLMIRRRGVWDLPKGKQEEGETVEACALREVREEVGISDLELLRPLGATVHGYVHHERYAVKTTYWFLMRTSETSFKPEAREGIKAVAWVGWAEARRRVGYDTLRLLMDKVGPVVSPHAAAGS